LEFVFCCVVWGVMDALVMAGGRGRRLGLGEKPLVLLQDKPLISYVLEALRGARGVEKVFVVTSPWTPRTHRWAEDLGVGVFSASGRGFIRDMVEAVEGIGIEGPVLVMACDIPFVTSGLLDEVICRYFEGGLPALAVYSRLADCLVVPETVFNIDGELLVPVGINILDGDRIREEQEEYRFVIERDKTSLNINTLKDLKFACKITNI